MADTYFVNGNLSTVFNIPNGVIVASPVSSSGVVGYLQGLSFGGITTMYGDGNTSGIRHFQIGLGRDDIEGSPAIPSLKLIYPGMWRFRWTVVAGTRTISIRTKQYDNVISQRPTIKIRSNVDVGLLSDLTSTAPTGNNWVTIGPLSFTATSTGVVWIEVWNNLNVTNKPAYFDHIVVT